MYIFLRLNTSRATKMISITPKRYDEQTHPFYKGVHPPPNPSDFQYGPSELCPPSENEPLTDSLLTSFQGWK